MVHLQPVTPENWRCGLRVREDQCEYVAGSDAILARAYAYRNSRSEALLIYNDETPVGMALYYDLEELQAYTFHRQPLPAKGLWSRSRPAHPAKDESRRCISQSRPLLCRWR